MARSSIPDFVCTCHLCLLALALLVLACRSPSPQRGEDLASAASSAASGLVIERACAGRSLQFVAWFDVDDLSSEAPVERWLRAGELPSWRRFRGCDVWVSCPEIADGKVRPDGYEAACRARATQLASGLAASWAPHLASIGIDQAEAGLVQGRCEDGVITDRRGNVVRYFGSCYDFGWLRIPLRWR